MIREFRDWYNSIVRPTLENISQFEQRVSELNIRKHPEVSAVIHCLKIQVKTLTGSDICNNELSQYSQACKTLENEQ